MLRQTAGSEDEETAGRVLLLPLDLDFVHSAMWVLMGPDGHLVPGVWTFLGWCGTNKVNK